MIIAIDGPAGSGKSTVARSLAKELQFIYLDTGAIYRALTLKALDDNIDLDNETDLIAMCKNTNIDISNNADGSNMIFLDSQDVTSKIRLPRITRYVSEIARIKGIREEMLKLQRRIGSAHNAVIEGRDIGTVVFPNAEKKFYLDADFNQRVIRRFKELAITNTKITKEAVALDLKNRDHIDSTRECAPLKKAQDAIYIDTTNMIIEEVVESLLKKIRNG